MSLPDPSTGYSNDEERPLAGYAGLVGLFNAIGLASIVALRRDSGTLPERIPLGDLALLSTATFKLSRLLGKDKVTSFLRAPFTEFQEGAGHGEVEEQPRGRGLRLAVGELLVCPYCLDQWVATGFVLGFLASPKATRLAAGALSIVALADALQIAYKAAENG